MNKLLFILLSFLNICSSFQLPLNKYEYNHLAKWKGKTHIYDKNCLFKYNINYVNRWYDTKYLYNDDKFNFHIQNGMIYGNTIQCMNPNLQIDDNKKLFKYEINFLYNYTRSIVEIEYEKDINNKIIFKSFNMTSLYDSDIVNENNKEPIYSIWTLINKISNWKGRFHAIHPNFRYNERRSYDIDSYDFRYFFMDISRRKRICHLGLDNLIISIPEEIEDYKQFSIICGCLLTSNMYKQVNINYNYNGYITSIDLYEYMPNIKVINNFIIIEMLKKIFLCN